MSRLLSEECLSLGSLMIEVASNEDAFGVLVFHEAGKGREVGNRLVSGEIGVNVDVEDVEVNVGARGV